MPLKPLLPLFKNSLQCDGHNLQERIQCVLCRFLSNLVNNTCFSFLVLLFRNMGQNMWYQTQERGHFALARIIFRTNQNQFVLVDIAQQQNPPRPPQPNQTKTRHEC